MVSAGYDSVRLHPSSVADALMRHLMRAQTISAVSTFFFAMTHFPEAQARAQAEIDGVIGPDPLPTTADRASLPYVAGVLRETIR